MNGRSANACADLRHAEQVAGGHGLLDEGDARTRAGVSIAATALLGVPHPPLASTPSVTSGPTASRTARTRATSPSGSMPTFTFIFRNPAPIAHRAISAAGSGSRPETDHFVGTTSRTLPPSSS